MTNLFIAAMLREAAELAEHHQSKDCRVFAGQIESFYRAVFNAGLKEAEMAAESITDDKDNSDSEKMGAEYVITAIRALDLRQ